MAPDNNKSATGAGARKIDGLRILIAEDSFPISFALELALEAEGATPVGPATTLAAAQELARSQELDLAVVDLQLGDHDSLPLIQQLADAGVETIVASGRDDTSDLAADFPGLRVLRKPYSPKALIDLIRSAE